MDSSKFSVKFIATGFDVKIPATGYTKFCELVENFFKSRNLDIEKSKTQIFFELGSKHTQLEWNLQSTLTELGIKKNSLIIVKDPKSLIVSRTERGKDRAGPKIVEEEQKEVRETFPEILGDMAEFSEQCLDETVEDTTEGYTEYKNYEEALEQRQDKHSFLFGLIGKYLYEVLEINVFINLDKDMMYTGEDKAQGLKTLRYLSNGLITKTKSIVSYASICSKDLDDIKIRKNINKNFKNQLLKKYTHLNDKNFVVRNIYDPEKFKFFLIPVKVDDLDLDETSLQKCKDYCGSFDKKEDPDFEEGKPIMETIILDESFLMKHFDSTDDSKFGFGERRGGEPYYPPVGWWRYGVIAKDFYGSNNVWLGYDYNKSWCVAYIGLRKPEIEDKVKEFENDEDMRHMGNKVGLGVAVCPKPEDMEEDCQVIKYKNEEYKIGFMLRIDPNAIKIPQSGNGKYWVVEATKEHLRPYSILSKRLK